jgi:4-oxalocrotonate tautomerase
MPYVNIKITKEGAIKAQKEKLISGVTNLLHETLGKNPKTTFVVIDEVETDNWGYWRRERGEFEIGGLASA